MSPLVRHARPEEWKIVRELNREIFDFESAELEKTWNVHYPFSLKARSYYEDACSDRNGLNAFVCEFNGDIVGYGILKLHAFTDQQHRSNVVLFQIDTLSVTKKHRNHGYGYQLIEHMKAYSRENGGTHLSIGVLKGNDRAYHLYGKSGFSDYMVMMEMKL